MTPSLQVRLVGVGSEIAFSLTDENWDGQIGMEDDLLPEIPPDGEFYSYFSSRHWSGSGFHFWAIIMILIMMFTHAMTSSNLLIFSLQNN